MLRTYHILIACLLFAMGAAGLHADEAPHARAYLDTLIARLQQIDAQMPAIAGAADLVAGALVEGKTFAVCGDDGLANELSNRAGALMGYDGRRGEAGDVALYVLGLERTGSGDAGALLSWQIEDMARLKEAGSGVIALGSADKLRRFGVLDEARGACAVLLDNAATLNRKRGLDAGVDDDVQDSAGVPMETVLNAAAAWAFECELFAALTRLDKVPVVRQSFEIDTLKRRWQRYGTQRFHHDRWLDPISPGILGHAYLNGLRGTLTDIGTASWTNLARTSRRANDTLASGGKVWLRAGGRYLPYHVGGQLAADPGVFTVLNHDGSDPELPAPGGNDYQVAVGRYEAAGSWEWGEPELLRKAGRGVTWVVNGYNTQRRDLYRNERLIDLWGPVGDCIVKVEHYDTRLGPVGSVTAEAVTWMLAAELVARQNAENTGNTGNTGNESMKRGR